MRAGRPLVMGVVNVTPDSFSDGGQWFDTDAAIAHGLELFAEGADVVDVGGESTRPGAEDVPVDEELRRVIPVIEALAVADGAGRVSVDTRKREVAERAVDAGATILNDVSASLYEVAAARPGTSYIAMHMKGTPQTMQDDPTYDDVVAEVRDFLVERATAARDAGVDDVWIDPGIGFGKTGEHNLAILRRLGAFVQTGFPVAIGTSRKKFLQRILDAPPDDVLEGTIATSVAAMAAGAGMVRVHDVRAAAQAARIVGEQVS